jgi:hypothetical protein
MTFDPADFIDSAPWRWVQQKPEGPLQKPPDAHQYVVRTWREVDAGEFDRFCELIRDRGYEATYRAPYRPEVELRNVYFEIDGWCYWRIGDHMLNRERAEDRKHTPIEQEQLRLGEKEQR